MTRWVLGVVVTTALITGICGHKMTAKTAIKFCFSKDAKTVKSGNCQRIHSLKLITIFKNIEQFANDSSFPGSLLSETPCVTIKIFSISLGMDQYPSVSCHLDLHISILTGL